MWIYSLYKKPKKWLLAFMISVVPLLGLSSFYLVTYWYPLWTYPKDFLISFALAFAWTWLGPYLILRWFEKFESFLNIIDGIPGSNNIGHTSYVHIRHSGYSQIISAIWVSAVAVILYLSSSQLDLTAFCLYGTNDINYWIFLICVSYVALETSVFFHLILYSTVVIKELVNNDMLMRTLLENTGKRLSISLIGDVISMTAIYFCSGFFFFPIMLLDAFSQAFAYFPSIVFFVLSLIFVVWGNYQITKNKGYRKDMDYCKKLLQEIFSRHLGDDSVSSEAMNAFLGRMAEYKRLSRAVLASEDMVSKLTGRMDVLSTQQSCFRTEMEKQQRIQWELEKKLEHLANCKTQAEGLRDVLKENERISQELAAIDLAQETMTELSTSIRDSFGLYLNKEASDLIEGITGGIYSSISVDENLNLFMNTPTKLVPVDQVSSGTMDQVYLALRLAAAKLIQHEGEKMPLIFDDSFVLYDDERLKTALNWLTKAFSGQMIIFTCHRREQEILKACGVQFHLVRI